MNKENSNSFHDEKRPIIARHNTNIKLNQVIYHEPGSYLVISIEHPLYWIKSEMTFHKTFNYSEYFLMDKNDLLSKNPPH